MLKREPEPAHDSLRRSDVVTGLGAALRHRDFALLWCGQAVSVTGDGIFTVALVLAALRADDRPSALSVVLAARLVPTVVLVLAGGMVVDRIPRRRAMLVSDVVRGAAVAGAAVLIAGHAGGLGALVVMAAIFGVADAFFLPAFTAVLPELLPGELLVQGNSLVSASQLFAQQLIGPALGGIVVAAAGVAWSFGIDAASFAVSAACLAAMRPATRPMGRGRSAWSDVREGLRYCRSQRWLWVTILGAGLANFAIFSPLGVLIPLLVRHVLHQGALTLGLILAGGGAGGAAVSLAVARRGLPSRPVTRMWAGWGASGLAAATLGLTSNAWALASLAAVTFGLMAYGNCLWESLLQQRVPARLLGRAASVNWLASFSLSPLGIVTSGAVAALLGTRSTLLAGGGLAAGTAAICLLMPGIRATSQGRPAFPRRPFLAPACGNNTDPKAAPAPAPRR